MSRAPILSVVLPATARPDQLGCWLWSILRQPLDEMEILVTAEGATRSAEVARHFMDVDHRVRLLDPGRPVSPDSARDARLEARGTYLAFAEAGGVVATGAYPAMVRLLERSGSDFATGARGTIAAKKPRRPGQPPDPANDAPGTALLPLERPELVVDGSLATTLFRSSFLHSHDSLRNERPSLTADELFWINAFCVADAIDVVPNPVFFRHQWRNPGPTGSPADRIHTSDRALQILREAGQLAAAGCYAEHLLTTIPAQLAEVSEEDSGLGEQCSALARKLIDMVPHGSLARLPVRVRWQWAMIAQGRPWLVSLIEGDAHKPVDALRTPLPEALTSVLGLGGDPLETVFRRRFLEPGPSAATMQERRTSTPPERPRAQRRSAPVHPEPAEGAIAAAPSSDISNTDQRHPAEVEADTPEISVVIPTHDVEDYLDELLHSVRAAVGVRLEIIVVDDHSTDLTWQILQTHAGEDSRIRLHRSPARGGGAARNLGIAAATGEWLCFADGDDIVPPEAYATMLATARRTEADIVTGNYEKFGENLRWNGGQLFGYDAELDRVDVSQHPRLITHRVCWNRLIRREFWLSHALEFPDVPRANDIVPLTRALLAADRISVVPVLSYRYRTRAGSMTAAQGSGAATVSYLTQETEAASLIRAAAEPHVQAEYWSVILPYDCWRHVRSYLGAAEFESTGEVADALTALTKLAPPAAWARLSPLQRAIYALMRDRQSPVAAKLLLTADRVGRLTHPEALDLAGCIHALTAASRTAALSQADLAQLSTALLLTALNRSRADLTLRSAEAAVALARELTHDLGVTFSPLPGTEDERIATVLRHGSPAQLRDVLASEPSPVPATLRSSRRRVWLEIPSCPPAAGQLWLFASRRIDGVQTQLPVSPVVRGTGRLPGRAALDLRDLPRNGRWQLSLRWEDEWGPQSSALQLRDRRRIRLPGRPGRLVVSTPGGTHVALGSSLTDRARRLARLLRRPWSRPSAKGEQLPRGRIEQ